jgi:hypothetical protein
MNGNGFKQAITVLQTTVADFNMGLGCAVDQYHDYIEISRAE